MRVLMITTDWPSSFMTRQVDHLRRAGVFINVFHFRGAKNPLNYLRAWYNVRRRLKEEEYDLIHAQFGQSAFPALPKQLPLVVTFRGSDVLGIVGSNGKYQWQGYLLKVFSSLIALWADQAVAVSDALIAELPKRQYHVIPSGLDLNMFYPMERSEARLRLGWPLNCKVVFFGGNTLMPEKRYTLACTAVNLLREEFPEVKLVVAENINHTEMPCYMNASDVLLLTSTHEGSPNVVKEALACNVPVVSTDVGDVRQRIGNIEGCIVCTDDQAQTISSALCKVLTRGARIAGRETVLDLDESRLAQKMLAVYKQAINKSQT
jgi:glycosyltransferase involved in cell wall biosynthesis